MAMSWSLSTMFRTTSWAKCSWPDSLMRARAGAFPCVGRTTNFKCVGDTEERCSSGKSSRLLIGFSGSPKSLLPAAFSHPRENVE